MSKKLTILIAGLVLVIGGIALWKIFNAKVENMPKVESPASQIQSEKSLQSNKKAASVNQGDSELADMEADLNSINNEDFGEAELSDEKVGL